MTIRRFLGLTARSATGLGAACIVTAGMLGIFADRTLAQQPPAADAAPPQQPAAAETTQPQSVPAATSAPAAAEKFLSLGEIERRVTATGLRVTEMEVKDRIVEVEGRDASNREVELVMDRRSGEVLSRKLDR